jgi:hypothetical protein
MQMGSDLLQQCRRALVPLVLNLGVDASAICRITPSRANGQKNLRRVCSLLRVTREKRVGNRFARQRFY